MLLTAIFRRRSVLSALLLLCVGTLPRLAWAWPSKWAECTSCHTTDASTTSGATVYVAIDGNDITASGTFDVTPSQTFEVDYAFTHLYVSGTWTGVGALIVLPTSFAAPSRGTAGFSPSFAGGPAWNPVWNDPNAAVSPPGWCGNKNCNAPFAVATAGMSGNGWTLDFTGSGWASTKGAATDDGTAADLDGTLGQMGADARITAPATPGTYTFWVVGIGHDSSGRSYADKAITLNVCTTPPCGSGDTTPPVVAGAVRLQALPQSADASFRLEADWTEANPGTPQFRYNLNGAGYTTLAPSDNGANNTAWKVYNVAIDGDDYFAGLWAEHTDAYANGPTVSEDTATTYVRPLVPPAPAVSTATASTLDVTVNENAGETGVGILYAIACTTTGQYVQADGTLGAAEIYQPWASWGAGGTVTVVGLTSSTTYSFATTAANPSDLAPPTGNNSTSSASTTGSGSTTAGANSPPTTSLDPLPGTSTADPFLFTGTASDSDGTVSAVLVRLQRQDDARYWNGAGWQAGVTDVSATNTGINFSTWSYNWTGFGSLDGVTLSASARAFDGTDYDGSPATGSMLVDNSPPTLTIAVHLLPDNTPESGTVLALGSSFSEANPGLNVPEFDWTLNGVAAGFAAATSYVGGVAQHQSSVTLDGDDEITRIATRFTDGAGNSTGPLQDTTLVRVRPLVPPAPTVDNPTSSSLDVTVNSNVAETGVGVLYAVLCNTTGQYVQGDGSLGAAPVFQTAVAWGGPIAVLGLASGTSYSFSVAAGNPRDITPSAAENTASSYGTGASASTSGAIDTDAPCAATGLQIVARTPTSLTLSFVAPFENCTGQSGTPTSYAIKYDFAAVDALSWDGAYVFEANHASTVAAGATETVAITGLDSNQRYYLQVKAKDAVGNVGPVASLVAPGSDAARTPLHAGWNIGGLEGTPGATNTCLGIFGLSGCYRWVSTGVGDWSGSYSNIGAAGVVSAGVGYWLSMASPSIDIDPPGDATPTSGAVSVVLQPGMNLVSNPHPIPVTLASLTVTRNGTDTRTFAEAADTLGWVAPAVYAYDGANYFIEVYNALPAGLMHPRKGYWLKLLVNDGATYRLDIPKP